MNSLEADLGRIKTTLSEYRFDKPLYNEYTQDYFEQENAPDVSLSSTFGDWFSCSLVLFPKFLEQ